MATTIPGASFQRLRAEISEDCLYLNIWTPSLDEARPVILWIHGGSFIWGAGSQPVYDGAQLATATDAVVVALNYRLGPLGWLCLDEEDGSIAPNLGLLDQIAALEWVHENIRSFGGDPERLTLAGVSAGACSVSALLASPRTEGLFKSAAMLSGDPYCPPRDEAAALGQLFLKELGLTAADTRELWNVPTEAILEASWRTVTQHARKPRSFRAWEPILDGELVTEQPYAALAAGNRSQTVIFASSTLEEMKLIPVPNPQEIAADLPTAISALVGVDRATATTLIEAYRSARGERGESTDPAELFLAIDTDAHFSVPSLRTVQAHSAGGGTAFASIFAWQSPNPELGAFHGIDVPFLFGTYQLPGMETFAGQGVEADALSRRFQGFFKELLRSEPGDALGEWEPCNEASGWATMFFGGPDMLVRGTTRDELLAWDGVI